jgi:signal peptidase I
MVMSKGSFGQRIQKVFRQWVPSLLLVCLVLVARSTLADHYHVPSGSMEHALMPGDHVVVNKAAYGLRVPFTKNVIGLQNDPQRGEVVIFDSPLEDVRLIKRVVAIGGDRVEVRRGRVFINGQPVFLKGDPLVEQYGSRQVQLNMDRGGGPDMASMTVPPEHVLVLGDHRGNSRDGRYFGTVPMSELYGRASGVFWRNNSGPLWQGL